MKNIKRLLILTGCMLLVLQLPAQTLNITGKVIDDTGMEVIGANISIKGQTGIGTISNIEGDYSLSAKSTDVLIFSYIGMLTQEVPVNGRTTLNITLKSDVKVLDEVVVIGYGASKRSDLTGSVVSIKSEDLMQTPTSDVTQALAGRVVGVQISQSEGEPGASVSIRVRGGISITQSNEPLYIIDGFPSEDGLATLDPAEIETIDILKDASATAIYGARGANGVVVVSTRKGAKDNTKINISFDTYIGFKTLAKKLSVLNPQEFVLLDYERSLFMYGEDGVRNFQNRYGSFIEIADNYGNRPGINWQDETLGRTALTQNYRVRVSGGNKDIKFNLGYAYFKDEGAMVYSGSDKHNISFNFSYKSSERFQINSRITFDQMEVYGMGTSEGNARFNKMEHILQYRPTIGIHGDDSRLLYDEDPLFVDDTLNPMQNPLLSAAEEIKKRIGRSIQANGGFTYNFNKHISFRNSTGMRYQVIRNDIFFGDKSSTAKRSSINGSIQYSESASFQTSNVFNYDYKAKKHKLNVILGQEWVSRSSAYLRAAATQFPNDEIGLDDMNLGTPSSIRSGVNRDDNLLSFFTRANYNLHERYLFTATIRADGSSKFSKKNKWGFFPSFSAAWRLSEEDFIKKLNVFSDLKLRVGYGMAGNNRVASYASLDLLGSVPYVDGNEVINGYAPSGIPSENLKWESNKTLNTGIDMGFFQQRLTVTPEFYLNQSSNLLLNSRVPGSSGFTTMLRNIGETQNVGFDLTIASTNISKKDFTWSTNFNLSYNRNTIKALSGEKYFLEEARFGYNQMTHKIEVGKPIGQFYGYKTTGLYQVDEFDYDATTNSYLLKEGIPYRGSREETQPGMWKLEDVHKDGVIDEKDMTVIGNAAHDFYGGLNNRFTYRDFDLSFLFSFSYGGQVLNATKLNNSKTGNINKNVLALADSRHRWMTIDPNGKTITDPALMASVNSGKSVAAIYDMEAGDYLIHSWAVEDASFVRLSNISIGYNVPRKLVRKYGIHQLRIYATGSNLFVWTPYSGFDPEVSTMGNNLTPGVDFGGYPRSRSFIFGLQLTL